MLNILIVEKDLNYCIEIINIVIKNNEKLRLCGIATTIDDALNFIKEGSIDIILINESFLAKLETKRLEKLKKLTYITFSKKYDLETLNIKINKVMVNLRKNDRDKQLKTLIENELLYLGYNPKYKGFNYLIETIFILNNLDKYFSENLSKDIYPLVATKFNTSPDNVKDDIRNATEAMYYDCPESKLSEYLGFDISDIPKPKTVICAIENNIRKKYNYS